MNRYRVSFYKDLLNSDGHNFKCLQRQVDVQSEGLSQVLVMAERLVDNERLNADGAEVMHVADAHLIGKPLSSDSVACAASLASEQGECLADHQVSADYRKYLVKTGFERARASLSAA